MGILKQSTSVTKVYKLGTGLTTVTLDSISKNGGTFAAPSAGTVTSLSNGWYKVALDETDTDTLGDLALHFTASAGTPVDPPADQVGLVVNLGGDVLGALYGTVYGDVNGNVTGSVQGNLDALTAGTMAMSLISFATNNPSGPGMSNTGSDYGQYNSGTNYGQYNYGGNTGQYNYGGNTGQYNYGNYGQHNEGSTTGQYNYGNNGQHNEGSDTGQYNSGTNYGQYNYGNYGQHNEGVTNSVKLYGPISGNGFNFAPPVAATGVIVPFTMRTTAGALATGKTVTCVRLVSGGSPDAVFGTITELAGGGYQLSTDNGATNDLANSGANVFMFTATGCEPTFVTVYCQPA
jgi:hypothetical protein